MSRQLSDRERKVRDEIVKSTLTGVGVAALAVVAFSSAGIGGLIGTSQASGASPLPAPEADPYVNLPPYPQPLTPEEFDRIRAHLASTSASLEITVAATEQSIERVRALAMTENLTTTSVGPTSNLDQAMRFSSSADGLRPQISVEEPPGLATAQVPPPEQTMVAADFVGGAMERDPHLEFAALLLRDEFQY